MLDVKKRHGNVDVVLMIPWLDLREHSLMSMHRDAVIKDASRLGMRLLAVPPSGLAPPRWLDRHADVYHPLSHDVERRLRAAGIKIAHTPLVAPPGIARDIGELHDPIADTMKLNAFGLEGYDAVVFYDGDVQLTGRSDVTQLFRCASQNYFLSTSGPGSSLDGGFMAFQPSVKLALVLADFAERNNFNESTGWAGLGFSPSAARGTGQQLFYYTVFYKTSQKINEAFDSVGAARPKARQLDCCVWNFMTPEMCDKTWSCRDAAAIQRDGESCRKVGPAAPANESS